MSREQGECSNNGSSAQGIHVVAKPIGLYCIQDCEYCFYLEKKALVPANCRFLTACIIFLRGVLLLVTIVPNIVLLGRCYSYANGPIQALRHWKRNQRKLVILRVLLMG
jgi:hypothetical protein